MSMARGLPGAGRSAAQVPLGLVGEGVVEEATALGVWDGDPVSQLALLLLCRPGRLQGEAVGHAPAGGHGKEGTCHCSTLGHWSVCLHITDMPNQCHIDICFEHSATWVVKRALDWLTQLHAGPSLLP